MATIRFLRGVFAGCSIGGLILCLSCGNPVTTTINFGAEEYRREFTPQTGYKEVFRSTTEKDKRVETVEVVEPVIINPEGEGESE